ncbi:MAG: CapA family protein [Salinivirgaceae bacterium]
MRYLSFFLLFFVTITSSNAQNKPDTVTIAAVGDIMLGTDFPEPIYLPPNKNCSGLLSPAQLYFQNAQLAFANLEGAFNDGAELVKRCNDPKVCYAFRTPQSMFSCIHESGLNLFSIANNHIMDFGMPGADSTIALAKQNQLWIAGVYKQPYEIFMKDSVLYGFTAFSPNKGTNDFHNDDYLLKTIKTLADTADIVIVSFHIGAEGSKHQHVTRETETFYGENRGNPYQLARDVIDAGADIVLGHGPHVARAFDIYKNRFIAYSLGNFCTYSRMNLRGVNGLAPLVNIKTTTDGEFIEGQIVSFKQYYDRGLVYDPQNHAAKKIEELTLIDIPECELKFEKNGYFSK